MFKKILIANRGEIACRVIKTARRMGIATVAVYSDADARAPFVQMADEAVHIGPPPAAESYLLPDKIIAACKQTGAEAVHPGYGFLSERASFVEALAKEGIAFIGPPANAIAAMGDKIESQEAGQGGGRQHRARLRGRHRHDTEHALTVSNEIGYPVMMKASAGGGGKGMRLAWNDKDVGEGFEATKREGLNSLRRRPRVHREIHRGPAPYRDPGARRQARQCALSERARMLDPAPPPEGGRGSASPFVTPEMRQAMGEQAVALSQAVGYHSAGTVELIVTARTRPARASTSSK